MFLPTPVYESLPILYTAQGAFAIVASSYNPAVIGFASLLFAASALITKMRRQHRRNLASLGIRHRLYV